MTDSGFAVVGVASGIHKSFELMDNKYVASREFKDVSNPVTVSPHCTIFPIPL